MGKRKVVTKILVHAPIGKRLLAMALDLLILNTFVIAPLSSRVMALLPAPQVLLHDVGLASVLSTYTATMAALIFGYFVLMEFFLQQSPGKMALGLLVVGDRGDKPGFAQIAMRNLNAVLIFPFLLLLVIEPAIMLYSGSPQRLSEQWSRTHVVEQHEVKA